MFFTSLLQHVPYQTQDSLNTQHVYLFRDLLIWPSHMCRLVPATADLIVAKKLVHTYLTNTVSFSNMPFVVIYLFPTFMPAICHICYPYKLDCQCTYGVTEESVQLNLLKWRTTSLLASMDWRRFFKSFSSTASSSGIILAYSSAAVSFSL